MKRGTGMFVAWKERLFLLTSKQLVYFDSGRLSAIKGSMLLRDIKTFDMALPVSKYGKRFCLYGYDEKGWSQDERASRQVW